MFYVIIGGGRKMLLKINSAAIISNLITPRDVFAPFRERRIDFSPTHARSLGV
jgi:hypothetical protein